MRKTRVSRSTLNQSPHVTVAPAGNRNVAFRERGSQGAPAQVDAGPEKIIIVHKDQIGSSGVRNFSGYPSEEYFQKLRGHLAADMYDQMRRGESQIKMCLQAVKRPIQAAQWEVKPPKEDANVPNGQKLADFISFVLFEDMHRPFNQFMNEALTCADFGHAVFEVVHKTVVNHKKWGNYNGIAILGWRSPRTIFRWHLNKDQGYGLDRITQYAFGDLARLVDIPGQFLMVVTLDQEGDSYEGISLLRAAYGPWFRKQEYLVMQAIGIEKYAIPTPIGTIPEGKQNSEQAANFETMLQNFTAHEKSYMVLPPGDWKVDFAGGAGKGSFDPEKVQKAIDAEDRNMVKAFIANFLELGQSSSSGSWALSFDQSSFFKASIEHIAHSIVQAVNKRVIKPLIDMNFGVQDAYPELSFSGITDEAGLELANALEKLAQSQIIIPDDDLEDHVRRRYKLSQRTENGQRKVVAKGALGGGDATKEDDQKDQPGFDTGVSAKSMFREPTRNQILLAEKVARGQIKAANTMLLSRMKAGLSQLASSYIEQVMRAYRAAAPADRVNAAKNIQPIGIRGYQSSLQDAIASVMGQALKQARREVPKAKNVKLAETLIEKVAVPVRLDDSYRLSDLPPKLQKKVVNKASALASSQAADLEKAITFQFDASEGSTDSESRIEADLEGAADNYLADSAAIIAAAGNAAAHAVNDARNAFFFDDDTLDEIESFTFVNGDPVSPICQDLAGRTFDKDDPDAARYFPPLHHNCKSYLVPNLAGAKDNPEIDDEGLKPSDPALEDSITLSERVSGS